MGVTQGYAVAMPDASGPNAGLAPRRPPPAPAFSSLRLKIRPERAAFDAEGGARRGRVEGEVAVHALQQGRAVGRTGGRAPRAEGEPRWGRRHGQQERANPWARKTRRIGSSASTRASRARTCKPFSPYLTAGGEARR